MLSKSVKTEGAHPGPGGQNVGTDSEDIPWHTPPPYELHSSGSVLASSTVINAQGGVDIEFASTSLSDVDRLLPPICQPDKTEQTPSKKPCPPLQIVIQVVGSRGDVQPFVALGTALRRRGHRVRLATHDVFATFVRSTGLEFYAIGGDPEDLMSYMVKNPGLIPSMESLRGGEIGRKRKMMHQMLRGCWRSCVEPDEISKRPFVADAIIANPPSFAHVHCAQALGVPIHMMFTMPWTATRAFPHPLANLKVQNMTASASNFLSYGVVDLMTWQGLGDIINAWRVKDLKLEPLPAAVGPEIVDIMRVPHTYCWSPTLVPKPIDWGNQIDISGFFLRDEPSYTPLPDLEAFLAKESPPVYVGFGSIVLEDAAEMTRVIKEACKRIGVRVIVSRGWSKLGGDEPNTDSLFYLGDCPHEWLFKRVAAVVHHGGAGTTACGLVNGCPTTIVPFFGDQPFWGSVVASRGAGPSPIPHKQLTVDNLAEAIRFCLDPKTQQAAQDIAAKMRDENGVEVALESFTRHLPVEDLTCDLLPQYASRWKYHPKSGDSRGTSVKVSNEALRILLQSKRVKMSDFEPLRPKEYHVENRRWDPLTAGASSTLGTITDFTTALGGTFIDPFKEMKRVRSGDSRYESSGVAVMATTANGLKDMTTSVTKGMLVDVPLALAEGLRNSPRLYGEVVSSHEPVTDVKDGCVVAAKNFGVGFYEGITGIVTKPMEGAKKEGAVGLLKGIGKGSMGLITKPGSAMFGLLAYPAQGAYKSVKSLERSNVKEAVKSGKIAYLEADAIDTIRDNPELVASNFARLTGH
ncbi:hypothetical protein B0J13DRAFT_549849 [Dactylonectria estremocensis]|uniref:Glycosyltransferase family 28 N-terminal domain-containing protein n=1 Tax=Dactylonectria estremocensis TaxID=1079267 RepID=A0A9P9F394_9HYPO|nr:hypothetical protein B0J13DRAFT_549849 [Dactylonectria estremocensis]